MTTPANLGRIRGNVASMIAQGAPEADIEAYVASEGVTAQDLRATAGLSPTSRMSPEDEAAYSR